jgi:hypothetical protein
MAFIRLGNLVLYLAGISTLTKEQKFLIYSGLESLYKLKEIIDGQ